MKQPKRKFIDLTSRDVGLILGIGTLAAILNTYPYPLVAAAASVICILLFKFNEAPDVEIEKEPAPDDRPIEKRNAEEIIVSKLNDGAIERAIDEQFDKMVNGIVDDLFGSYGDISRKIQSKLKETMNPYIEQYDFSEHSVKLEHLLNQLVTEMTKEQNTLTRNLRDMMGTSPITEIKSSELFDKYAKYIGEHIETDDRGINYDDEPSYDPLTAELITNDETSYASMEKKTLLFTCEDDNEFDIQIGIQRWPDLSNQAWHIDRIERVNTTKPNMGRTILENEDLTTLKTPIANLRELSELEVFLLKLHYDRTEIILDETSIYDEDIEIEAKPEAYLA